MLIAQERVQNEVVSRSSGISSLDMTRLSNRFYVTAFGALLILSTSILLIASTAKTPVPAWGGYLDVGIVLLIAFAGFTIYRRNKTVPRYETSYQIGMHLFPFTLAGMWNYRNALDFNILLPGVAWRTYFLLSLLPHALSLWKLEQHP